VRASRSQGSDEYELRKCRLCLCVFSLRGFECVCVGVCACDRKAGCLQVSCSCVFPNVNSLTDPRTKLYDDECVCVCVRVCEFVCEWLIKLDSHDKCSSLPIFLYFIDSEY
jgi:hypothetical protein